MPIFLCDGRDRAQTKRPTIIVSNVSLPDPKTPTLNIKLICLKPMAAFAISRKTRGTLNSPYLLDHNCIYDLTHVYWTSNWSHIFVVQIRYSNADSNNKRVSDNWSAENTIQIKFNLCRLRQSGPSSLKECPVYLISHLYYNLPEKQSWIAGFEKCSRSVIVYFYFHFLMWRHVRHVSR